jgi:amidohydrolase
MSCWSSFVDELVTWRRHLHAHPELGFEEHETTAFIATVLSELGLAPRLLEGTGVTCDLWEGDGPLVLLRADIDALPLQDTKAVAYRSTNDGITHACGHDAHTAMLLGAAKQLRHSNKRIRLLFQPAEELMPGGALSCIEQRVLDGVSHAFALHCDPSLEAGQVGVRTGAITSAADFLEVRLSGPGGHTSRPHRTVDLVGALAAVASEVPLLLSRRLDPRVGTLLVWGAVQAGEAANAIPSTGFLRGTVRILDAEAWSELPDLVSHLVQEVAAVWGATVEVAYRRGVPPVVNAREPTMVLTTAAGERAVPTAQSLGGEDFAWYAQQVPASMARLGVGRPGWSGPPIDLHQASFDLDESALAVGVDLLVRAALSR